jgi:DnaJ-class molecular chaperone
MPRRNNVDSSDQTVRCPRCGGTGIITNFNADPAEGASAIYQTCPLCAGLGRVLPGTTITPPPPEAPQP